MKGLLKAMMMSEKNGSYSSGIVKRLTSILLCIILASCGGGTTGISGDNNDDNQVAIGDNNIVGDGNISGDNNIVGDGNISGDNNNITVAPDETPPDLTEDIPPISLSTESYEQSGSGCGDLIEEIAFASEYVGVASSLNEPIVLQDENKIQTNFYMSENEVSSSTKSWFPSIFVPGRKLRIQYYMCGNGPIRNLTYVEALSSEN